MKIKLDDDVKNNINSLYEIDPSVFEQIHLRNQYAKTASSSIKTILDQAPKEVQKPEESTSTIKQILNDADYEYRLKQNELNTVLDQLALLDAKIDRIDGELIKIDKKILSLIKEINDQINSISDAYEFQIQSGCKSDLYWENVGQTISSYTSNGSAITNDVYKVVKKPGLKIKKNYHGVKYYQKPLDRDYGYNINSTFNGTISAGSTTIAVISVGGTTNIQIGDQITDNLDNPTAFTLGNLPEVVGFGTTSAIGITTSDYFNVSVGSTILAFTGIGTTTNIYVGDYVLNSVLFPLPTQVVGFGTTTINISFISNTGIGTSSVIVPSVIVSKPGVSSATDAVIGFGTYSTYPSIQISEGAIQSLNNSPLFAIGKIEDIESNFDYTSNPSDPVKIGLMNKSEVGYGHKIEYVKNGEKPDTVLWNQILNETEPAVGAGYTVYYSGVEKWPFLYFLPNGYAPEGTIYRTSSDYDMGGVIGYTLDRPPGSPSNEVCSEYQSNINQLESELDDIISKNEPQIKQLISSSIRIRIVRDKYQLQAWGYLQASAYLRGELNELKSTESDIQSYDYESI